MNERLASLDGWRALSIVLVMISHFPYAQGGEFLFNFPIVFSQGDFGVRIFFVISGFLITYLLLQELNHTGKISLKRFYIRRTIRIWPVYFSYVLLLLLFQAGGLYSDKLSSWIGALTFTRNVVGVGNSATVHFWSLAVEEQFYLFFPFLLVTMSLWFRIKTSVFLLLAVISVAIFVRTYDCVSNDLICKRIFGARSILRYADSLAIGCFFAFLISLRKTNQLYNPCVFWAAALSLIVLRLELISLNSWLSFQGTIEAILIGACITTTIVTKPKIAFALLNNTSTMWLGKLSFSLYVWHVMFLNHFMKIPNPSFIFDWRMWWIPSLLVAIASYYLIELQFVRARQRYR